MAGPQDRERLTLWVLYENPKDFPGQFVIRGQDVVMGGQSSIAGTIVPHAEYVSGPNRDVLEHQFLSDHGGGLTWLPRHPGDEAQILGSWV